MQRMKNCIGWEVNGIRYAIVDRQLVISRGQTCLASLNLVPQSATTVRSTPFSCEGNRIWAGLEGGVAGMVVIELKDEQIMYTVETSVKHFNHLTYFPDSTINGDLWHTFIWTHWDKPWGLNEDVSVRVGDCRPDTVDIREGVVVDPGDTPPSWPGRGGPRAVAMHHPDFGWWGICVPGPLPVCDTYFNMKHRKFGILFDYLSPGCEDGFMPTVRLVLHLSDHNDPYSILGTMWSLSEPWRLIPGKDYEEETKFVGMPMCHPWEAMQQAAGNAYAAPIPPAEKGSPMNTDFLLSLLRELVELEPSLKWYFQLPQGWYKCAGDFSIGDNFGGEKGFRNLAEQFRQGGHLLTVHERLHHFNGRSQVGREHPDWVAPLRHGKPKPYYWSSNEEFEGIIQIMDVTREEVREHLKGQVRRFLSDAPGCLNMDGNQMTGDNWPSSLDYELSNEEYGVGDLLSYKINRELFLYGKSIKPYAWLAGTYNPLYGMRSDAGTMEDHLPIPINTFSQLRLITNLFPIHQMLLASYCMTRTKALIFWPLSVAVGIPEVNNPRAFTNPLLNADWIDMDDRYRRRLRSSLAVYTNSPVTIDTVNVPARVEQMGLRMEVFAGRRRTKGSLAGFYGAMSLGSQAVVTYSETKAMVSSTKSQTITFLLPPGKKVKAVERLTHQGVLLPHEYCIRDADGSVEITLHIEDCGGEAKLVQVLY